MQPFDPFLHLNEIEPPLDWPAVFGNDHPVEVEIGIGKGTLLRRLAAAAPGRNFVGIERANKYIRIAGQRIARDRQTNIRLVRTDAVDFLDRFIHPESVAVFHVYFSDPWPKKRHAKRRLFQAETVRLLESRLEQGGRVFVRTDVDWYYDDIVWLFEDQTQLTVLEKGEAPAESIPPELRTNYEVKFRAVGKSVYRITLQK
jgi:tRNA (guanine-N7-)-methyltransferase